MPSTPAIASDIERLIAEIRPVTRRILSRYRRVVPPEDIEDIAATVDLHLLEKLRNASVSDDAIESLHHYAAKLTYNAINDHLRERYPRRARLKTLLRRAVLRESRLAMWPTPRGMACGLREWSRTERVAEIVPQVDRRLEVREEDPTGAVLEVLGATGRPVLFDDLVGVIADLWDIADSAAPSIDPNELRSRDQTAIERLALREEVVLLWNEIRQLRPMQRKALLLGLRYGGTTDIVATLTLSGLATFEEIAATLELSSGELAAIWNALPLDDLQIAAILHVTRQQVINLRKSARERLARRFRGRTNTEASRTSSDE